MVSEDEFMTIMARNMTADGHGAEALHLGTTIIWQRETLGNSVDLENLNVFP